MNVEQLTEWGLSPEQAKRVMEGLNGSFVTKNRFNEVNSELQAVKIALKEREEEPHRLREQLARLESESREAQARYAAELRAVRVNAAADTALRAARAVNPAVVKPLLADFLSQAALAEDGSVSGLTEAIQALAESPDTAFLFTKTAQITGARSAERGESEPCGMTLAGLRGLSPAGRRAFAAQHPEEYKELYGGNV